MPKILITGARAPSALYLARLMQDGGWDVILADSLRFPMGSLTEDRFEILRYPSPRFQKEAFCRFIVDAVSSLSVDLVVPVCEEALHLSEGCKELLGERLATAAPEAMIAAHSKFRFTEDLRSLGLPCPSTRLFRPGMTPGSDVVLKPVWSRFGESVLFNPSPSEALNLPHDVEWVEQKRIHGTEVCATAFCVRGRVTAYCSYEPKHRAGQGAGMYFEPVVSGRLEEMVRLYARARDWDGFLSFDAIADEAGEVWPIECNPRGTSGIHLFKNSVEFAAAVSGEGEASGSSKPSALKSGIALSRLFRAVSPFRMGRELRADLRRADDALGYSNRRSGLKNAIVTSAELFLISRRERISILSASTHDLIWENYNASS